MSMAFDLGVIALQRGANDVAIRHFQDVLGQDPDDVLAHAMLSIGLSGVGRRFAARVEAGRALQGDPEQPIGHVASAYAEILHHDYRAAETAFLKALELDPENRPALLGRCRMARARQDADALETALNEYRAKEPADPEVSVLQAHLSLLRGDVPGAEAAARAALSADPEDADAYGALGYVHLRKGDAHKARHMALTALNIAPEDRDAHHLLAMAKMQEKPVIGYWQRFSLWMSLGGAIRVIGVLIAMWVAYRVGVAVLDEMGFPTAAGALQLMWLGFVAMTWIAGFQYRRMVEKDLEHAKLDPDY